MTAPAHIWHRLFATNADHQALEAALTAGLVQDPCVVVEGLPLLHAFLRAQAYLKPDDPKRGFINVWGAHDVSAKDPQPRDPQARPALERSVLTVVQALLNAGAHPFALAPADPKWGQDALDAAVALGQPSVVALLLAHPACPPVETLLARTGPNGSRRDPWLHALAAKGQAAIMEVLLEKGWPVDGLNKKGASALFEVRNLDGLETLLAYGASTALTNSEGLGVVEAWGSRPQAYSYWTMSPKELADHLPDVADNPALLQQAVLKDVFSSTANLFNQNNEFDRLTAKLNEAHFDAATWRVNGVGKFAGAWTPVGFQAIQTLMGRSRGLMPWKVLLSHPRGRHGEHEVIAGVPEKDLLWLGLWKAMGRNFTTDSESEYVISLQQAQQKFQQALWRDGITSCDPSSATLVACSHLLEAVKASSAQVSEVLGGLENWLAWKQKFQAPTELLEALWDVRNHGLQGINSYTWWEFVKTAYSPEANARHQAMWSVLMVLSPPNPSQAGLKELIASRLRAPVDWEQVTALVDPNLKEAFKQALHNYPLWQSTQRAYTLEQAYGGPVVGPAKPRF